MAAAGQAISVLGWAAGATEEVPTPTLVPDVFRPGERWADDDSSASGTELKAVLLQLQRMEARQQGMEEKMDLLASTFGSILLPHTQEFRRFMEEAIPPLLAAANHSIPVVTPMRREVQQSVISRPPSLEDEMATLWARNTTLPDTYNQLWGGGFSVLYG